MPRTKKLPGGGMQRGPRMEGQEMRAWREKLSLQQDQAGLLLGVDKNTISRWERGDSPIPAHAGMLVYLLQWESNRALAKRYLSAESLEGNGAEDYRDCTGDLQRLVDAAKRVVQAAKGRGKKSAISTMQGEKTHD